MHHSTTLAEVTMTYRSSRPGPDGRRHALRIPRRTLGMDLGDRRSDLCLLDEAGRVMARDRVRTTRRELESALTEVGPCRVIMEVGTHSPWISRLAHELGNEVIVANPRKVQLIAKGTRKNDRKDAMLLARLGRADTELLSPIQHRGEVAQWLLLAVRQRAGLVRGRSALINQVRGLVKSLGERVRGCSPGGFPRRARQDLSADMVAYLQPTLRCIEMLTSTIREFDRSIEDPDGALAPVVQRLRRGQVGARPPASPVGRCRQGAPDHQGGQHLPQGASRQRGPAHHPSRSRDAPAAVRSSSRRTRGASREHAGHHRGGSQASHHHAQDLGHGGGLPTMRERSRTERTTS